MLTRTFDLAVVKRKLLLKKGATLVTTEGAITIDGSVGTGTATAGVLKLTTPETTIVDADQLGRIDFSAPYEASGTDAVLVGASIWAEADDTFSATVNDTDLVFATGLSAAATEKMRLSSSGELTVTSAAASAFAVGLAGATNPSFAVDSSTGSQAAGLKITGATAAGTVAAAVISSGADANLTINAKGTGTIGIGSVSTGTVTITPLLAVANVSMAGTTGNQEIRLTDNLADALSLKITSSSDIAVIKTSTNAIEIDIAKEVVLQGGAFASSYATGSGTVFTSAKTGVARFYGESTSDLTSAVNARVGVFRHLIVTASDTINHETYGLVGQCNVKNTTLAHLHAGLMGTFEVSTAATVNSAYAYGAAGVMARLGVGSGVLVATKPICGFAAVYNGAALSSGSSVAFAACSTTSTNFTHLLAADHCDNILYAATGTAYENGVKIATQLAGNAYPKMDGVIRMMIDSTAYYIPFYAAGNIDNE